MTSGDATPDLLGADETGPTGPSQRRAAAAAKLAPPGTQLGDYVVIAALGQGGFGAVYHVENTRTGQHVAMKILHQQGMDSSAIARFSLEVDVVRRLDHPNVVDIYESGWLPDGQRYFTMELLDGRTLRRHVRARGSLLVQECIDLLVPLCDALAAVHGQGIVHRDLKMSNVFLSDAGGSIRPVLLDFGVAKRLGDKVSAITHTRQMVGTLSQMSPEQLLCQPVDARTDVYALGGLLFGMLTGRRPFHDADGSLIREFHLTAQRPRPSLIGNVPVALDAVVERAMAIDKQARYPSARAFLDALRAAAAQPSSGDSDEPSDRHAIGLYVGVHVEDDALDDDSVLDQLDDVIDAITEALSGEDLVPAVETSTEFLFIRPIDSLADRDAGAAVLALADRLWAQLSPTPHVRVRICAHVAQVSVQGDAITGGDLIDFTRWATRDRDGVSVTDAFERLGS